MDKLVDSSPKTLHWLNNIISKVKKRNPSLIYEESKYWASLKNPETNRKIVFMHPQRNQIRLFTKLDVPFDPDLQPTPASGRWADSFPSIFIIRSEKIIEKAIELIIRSYEYDLYEYELHQ